MSCTESDAPIYKNVYRLPSGIIAEITFHSFPADSLTKSNSILDFPNFAWEDFEPDNKNEILRIQLDKPLQLGESLINGMTSKKLAQSTLQESESANLTQQKRMVKVLHNYSRSPETICPLNHLSALPNFTESSTNVAATIKNRAQSPLEDVHQASENLAQQRRMVEVLHNYCRCPKREEENRIATRKKLRQYAALVYKQKKKINKLQLQVQMLERTMRCKEL